MTTLDKTHPALVNEWHPTKNGQLVPADVSYGSVRKVWWLGECTHEWEAIIQSRANGTGCPFCSGRKVLSGFNDLKTLNLEIANEWHPLKNHGFSAETISSGSQKKIWWQDEYGHEWEASVANRIYNASKCPICAGRKILIGFNDLSTTHPTIAKEWNPARNMGISLEQIMAGSHKKVWWQDEYGHEWETSPKSRTQAGSNCPFCSGNKVLKGFNDLSTTHPELLREWHPSKNTLSPFECSKGSTQRISWICKLGHEWETTIASRTSRSRGCPVCANKKVLVGYNDISTTHPHLITEWNHQKNLGTDLLSITYGNDNPVWWICVQGHEWKVAPYNRAFYKTRCPECAAATFVSKPEQEIAQWLMNLGVKVSQSARQVIRKYELDMYLPDHNLAIEYNGLYWHSEAAGRDKSYHYNKWLFAKTEGIQLLQIWEDEYLKNPEQVKSMILHKIGMTVREKVFARKTVVAELEKSAIEEFLDVHHIQGYASGTYYLGLQEKTSKELVAAIVLKNEPGQSLNIIRYATSKNVVGGFTKLISYVERNLKPKTLVTFSDNCVSDGGLYANTGFIVDKEIEPDYRYVVNNERKHKFGYRLKKFREDPNLQWLEGMTEKELAQLNSIPRIWDAGKIRWVKYCK